MKSYTGKFDVGDLVVDMETKEPLVIEEKFMHEYIRIDRKQTSVIYQTRNRKGEKALSLGDNIEKHIYQQGLNQSEREKTVNELLMIAHFNHYQDDVVKELAKDEKERKQKDTF